MAEISSPVPPERYDTLDVFVYDPSWEPTPAERAWLRHRRDGGGCVYLADHVDNVVAFAMASLIPWGTATLIFSLEFGDRSSMSIFWRSIGVFFAVYAAVIVGLMTRNGLKSRRLRLGSAGAKEHRKVLRVRDTGDAAYELFNRGTGVVSAADCCLNAAEQLRWRRHNAERLWQVTCRLEAAQQAGKDCDDLDRRITVLSSAVEDTPSSDAVERSARDALGRAAERRRQLEDERNEHASVAEDMVRVWRTRVDELESAVRNRRIAARSAALSDQLALTEGRPSAAAAVMAASEAVTELAAPDAARPRFEGDVFAELP